MPQITFHLYSCNAGLHEMSIVYALLSDDPPRPLSLTVNGRVSQQGGGWGNSVYANQNTDGSRVEFPATGAWTEWGRVYVQVCAETNMSAPVPTCRRLGHGWPQQRACTECVAWDGCATCRCCCNSRVRTASR